MSWHTQLRTLEVAGDALPTWGDAPLFVASRLRGKEKLGRLYDYEVDVSTIEASGLYVSEMHTLVDVNRLVGKRLTVKIAVEGNGTWIQGVTQEAGAVNLGADVREISGVIARVKCLGADERRMFYRFRLRPWLWLATLNRENRVFMDMTVAEITREVLAKYPFPVRWMLGGPGYGRKAYPKRDYQRQFWESDWELLNRLWQEWGITFHYDGIALVLRDGASFSKQGSAYRTIRYLDRDGQRIDEEHIHTLEMSRELTTGKVAVIDYDYTRSEAKSGRRIQIHRDATFDNAEEYTWADYAQPQQGAMGLNAAHNDDEFEADHLARVRAEAHRCRSQRIRGEGNLRGLVTGRTFFLEGYPFAPVNKEYVVTGTAIEIVNNDTITQGGVAREYRCKTKFSAQRANQVYRTPPRAKKPRAFAETAIVSGYGKSSIYPDAMARVKLWFMWDRVGQRDENATCWVPLAQVWQGSRYGALWIPRVGDHVHVGYVNADPDRPFVLSSHTTDYNPAPWDLAMNHALSGWRSQDLDGRASNAVVTDDTPGKLQVQVTSDHANSRFVAGYNVRINGDKGRQEARGEGIEIATDAQAVIRASGILVTTEVREGAAAAMKDMGETVQRLTAARELQESLLEQAQYHEAQQVGTDQSEVANALKSQNDAIRGGTKNDNNQFPELSEPQLVLASAAGTALTAERSTHIASNEHLALTTGLSVGIATGKSFLASIRERFSIFVQQMGITLVAAAGKVSVEAKTDGMSLIAQKVVEIISERDSINLKTPKEITLSAGGTQLTLNSSGVFFHTGGQCLIHCADFDTLVPEARPLKMPIKSHDEQFTLVNKTTGKPLSNVKYKITRESGEAIEGITDAGGKTIRIITNGAEKLVVHLIHWGCFMSDIQSPPIGATSIGVSATAPVSAPSTAIGSGVSNPHPTSNVTVPVADTVLRWEVQNNLHGDALPIIPSASTVQHGKILYQLSIKITVTQLVDGIPVQGKSVSIKSSRAGDVVRLNSSSTALDGTLVITLESRNFGDLQLSVENHDISAEPLSISLKNAWYEGAFLITGYNVCNESDFAGLLTDGDGLGDQHRYDFLFSASGVIMQGTGMALNGRYVRFVSMTTTWHLNSHGHRDHIQDPAQVTFMYTDSVQGAFGPVTANHSIAVDRNVIPPRAHVSIDGVGERYADDRGSAIVGRHIDNFLGSGAGVVQAWLHAGVNGTQRRVKYIKD